MRWSCDRTGYPLLQVPELGVAVSLWPIARPQFEQYLAEPGGRDDDWYAGVLGVAERVSWRDADRHDYERQFMLGLLPEEAEGDDPRSGIKKGEMPKHLPNGLRIVLPIDGREK